MYGAVISKRAQAERCQRQNSDGQAPDGLSEMPISKFVFVYPRN